MNSPHLDAYVARYQEEECATCPIPKKCPPRSVSMTLCVQARLAWLARESHTVGKA